MPSRYVNAAIRSIAGATRRLGVAATGAATATGTTASGAAGVIAAVGAVDTAASR